MPPRSQQLPLSKEQKILAEGNLLKFWNFQIKPKIKFSSSNSPTEKNILNLISSTTNGKVVSGTYQYMIDDVEEVLMTFKKDVEAWQKNKKKGSLLLPDTLKLSKEIWDNWKDVEENRPIGQLKMDVKSTVNKQEQAINRAVAALGSGSSPYNDGKVEEKVDDQEEAEFWEEVQKTKAVIDALDDPANRIFNNQLGTILAAYQIKKLTLGQAFDKLIVLTQAVLPTREKQNNPFPKDKIVKQKMQQPPSEKVFQNVLEEEKREVAKLKEAEGKPSGVTTKNQNILAAVWQGISDMVGTYNDWQDKKNAANLPGAGLSTGRKSTPYFFFGNQEDIKSGSGSPEYHRLVGIYAKLEKLPREQTKDLQAALQTIQTEIGNGKIKDLNALKKELDGYEKALDQMISQRTLLKLPEIAPQPEFTNFQSAEEHLYPKLPPPMQTPDTHIPISENLRNTVKSLEEILVYARSFETNEPSKQYDIVIKEAEELLGTLQKTHLKLNDNQINLRFEAVKREFGKLVDQNVRDDYPQFADFEAGPFEPIISVNNNDAQFANFEGAEAKAAYEISDEDADQVKEWIQTDFTRLFNEVPENLSESEIQERETLIGELEALMNDAIGKNGTLDMLGGRYEKILNRVNIFIQGANLPESLPSGSTKSGGLTFEEYGEQLGILLNSGASPTNPQGAILNDPLLVDAYKQMYGQKWEQEMKKLNYGRGRLMSTQLPQGIYDILKENFTGASGNRKSRGVTSEEEESNYSSITNKENFSQEIDELIDYTSMIKAPSKTKNDLLSKLLKLQDELFFSSKDFDKNTSSYMNALDRIRKDLKLLKTNTYDNSYIKSNQAKAAKSQEEQIMKQYENMKKKYADSDKHSQNTSTVSSKPYTYNLDEERDPDHYRRNESNELSPRAADLQQRIQKLIVTLPKRSAEREYYSELGNNYIDAWARNEMEMIPLESNLQALLDEMNSDFGSRSTPIPVLPPPVPYRPREEWKTASTTSPKSKKKVKFSLSPVLSTKHTPPPTSQMDVNTSSTDIIQQVQDALAMIKDHPTEWAKYVKTGNSYIDEWDSYDLSNEEFVIYMKGLLVEINRVTKKRKGGRVARSNCHRDKRSKGMEAPDMLLWFEDFQIPPSNTLSADQTRELAKRKFSDGKILCAHDVKDTEKLYVGRRLKLSKEYLENWNRKAPQYPKDVHSWSKPSVWQVRDSSATLRGNLQNGETWLQEYIQRKRWVDVKKMYSGNEMDSEGRVVTEIDIPVTDNKSVLKNVTLLPNPFQDDKRVVVDAIVDTGAELNEISYEVAKRLGLYDQQNKIGTEILLSNTNSYKTFEANIWIHIDRKSLKDKLHDQETVNNPHIMENLTVVFPQQEMESSVELLIGRTGIKELRFVIRTV